MAKKVLTTPISAEDLEDIHVGDVIYLTGKLTTCRDVAHRRVIEEGRKLPVDIRDGAILHAGPIIRQRGEGDYEMVTVGPTTSMRMEKFEEAFIKETGVRLIIGKGGMGEGTMRGRRDNKALHCVFPAGCAVVAATCVEKILSANWKDLGMPETLWTCQVKEFGPLIVSMTRTGATSLKRIRSSSTSARKKSSRRSPARSASSSECYLCIYQTSIALRADARLLSLSGVRLAAWYRCAIVL